MNGHCHTTSPAQTRAAPDRDHRHGRAGHAGCNSGAARHRVQAGRRVPRRRSPTRPACAAGVPNFPDPGSGGRSRRPTRSNSGSAPPTAGAPASLRAPDPATDRPQSNKQKHSARWPTTARSSRAAVDERPADAGPVPAVTRPAAWPDPVISSEEVTSRSTFSTPRPVSTIIRAGLADVRHVRSHRVAGAPAS